MSIDMHCHLDLYPDPFQVAEECKSRGLYVLSVTTTPKAWDGTRKLAEDRSRIRTALGLHPQLAHQRVNELELFDALLPNAKYIGEIGLDHGRGFADHWDVQLKVFRHILKSVDRSGGRIMSVHTRFSAAAVLDELESALGIPILHWFTGNKSELKKAIQLGCLFSVSPAMLNSKRGKELVRLIPRNKILTETDGPFAKVNDQPLMPWDVELAFPMLAAMWGVSIDDAKHQVLLNFKSLWQ